MDGRPNPRRARPQGLKARSALDSEPRIVAVPFLERSRGRAVSLLTASEAAELSAMAEPVRFGKGETIYRANTPVDSLYNLVQGVAKTFRIVGSGGTHVTRFLFPGDVLGLGEQGHYVDTAETLVPCLAYGIPVKEFSALLDRSGSLAVRMACRLAHDLRETQHQSVIIARNDAPGRIVMFLELLGRADLRQGPGGTSYLPMSRSEIAQFVGLTIEAVSRAFSKLEQQKILASVDRHHFHIVDRERFQAMCDGAELKEVTRRRGGNDAKRRNKGA
jgi:CRP/FNR family transcriptional regulator